MDIRKIKKLIEIIEESGIAEMEIKEGEEAIRISRYSAAPAPVSLCAICRRCDPSHASSCRLASRRKNNRPCR